MAASRPSASAIIRTTAEKLFSALRDDMYPEESCERCFGVVMGDGLGSTVYNAWKMLFLRGIIDVDEVSAALQSNTLPDYFEHKVRSLNEHSHYTQSLIASNAFGRIAWDSGLHSGFARHYAAEAATPERAPAVQAFRRDASSRSRRALFSDDAETAAPPRREVFEGDRAMRYAAEQYYDGYSSRQFVVRHLSSARGALLNGKRATAVGRDRAPWPAACRIHVRVEGELPDAPPLKLHTWNLAHVGSFTSVPSATCLAEPRCLALLRDLVDHFSARENAPTERLDQKARLAFLRTHVSAGRVPPPVGCCDPLLAESELPAWLVGMSHMRPCCFGDGQADLRRFAEGMRGAGGTCAVCLAAVEEEAADDEAAMGLPCGHVFHRRCAAPWVAERNACPTCRLALPRNLQTGGAFTVNNAEQLVLRLREWVVSGMCERCSMACHEQDPMVAVTGADGTAHLVPQSVLEREREPMELM